MGVVRGQQQGEKTAIASRLAHIPSLTEDPLEQEAVIGPHPDTVFTAFSWSLGYSLISTLSYNSFYLFGLLLSMSDGTKKFSDIRRDIEIRVTRSIPSSLLNNHSLFISILTTIPVPTESKALD